LNFLIKGTIVTFMNVYSSPRVEIATLLFVSSHQVMFLATTSAEEGATDTDEEENEGLGDIMPGVPPVG
jgi:hypothetical protein